MRRILAVAVLLVSGIPTANAVIVYQNGFESGSLGSEWTTSSSTLNGLNEVSNTVGLPTHSGTFHLVMGRTTTGADNLNEAVLTLDLSGLSDVLFSFWHKNVFDEDHPLPVSFTGSANGDGVSMSEDGTTWYTLTSLSGPSVDYTQLMFDLSAETLAAGISLGANFRIKFQQFDNFAFDLDGRTFDDILICSDGDCPVAVPEPSTRWVTRAGIPETQASRLTRKDPSVWRVFSIRRMAGNGRTATLWERTRFVKCVRY